MRFLKLSIIVLLDIMYRILSIEGSNKRRLKLICSIKSSVLQACNVTRRKVCIPGLEKEGGGCLLQKNPLKYSAFHTITDIAHWCAEVWEQCAKKKLCKKNVISTNPPAHTHKHTTRICIWSFQGGRDMIKQRNMNAIDWHKKNKHNITQMKIENSNHNFPANSSTNNCTKMELFYSLQIYFSF